MFIKIMGGVQLFALAALAIVVAVSVNTEKYLDLILSLVVAFGAAQSVVALMVVWQFFTSFKKNDSRKQETNP